MANLIDKVAIFLGEADQFRLGNLETESSHPLTTQLSKLAIDDLPQAIELFRQVEVQAFEKLARYLPEIEELKTAMLTCLKAGGRIFFCGCGATGRLSISLETNWRESLVDGSHADSVIGFIAGGDYALVKSIENFEDHPEYGEAQLQELGFSKSDLLVSCTEGGETPFVIGATLTASQISNYKTYFLFCNSKDSLLAIARSKSVFENSRVRSFSFEGGPQAICGSTRLQASSLLYYACGLALFTAQDDLMGRAEAKNRLEQYINFLKSTELSDLKKCVELEAQTYLSKEFLTYHLAHDPMPILTDLTERSPTFNLLPVENRVENSTEAATANLCIDSCQDARSAWQFILKRSPRALSWPKLNGHYNEQVMFGFDFSPSALRKKLIATRIERRISVDSAGEELSFTCNGDKLCSLKVPAAILEKNLFLKFIFNLISTLAQCQNGRVLGNIMLFVKPSNKKLIDRAARFSQIILRNQHGVDANYADIVYQVFVASEDLRPEESVVSKTVNLYLKVPK